MKTITITLTLPLDEAAALVAHLSGNPEVKCTVVEPKAKPKAKAKAKPKAEPAPEPEGTVTADEVKAAAQTAVDNIGGPAVRKLLKAHFKANRLSEVEEPDWPRLVQALEVATA